MRTLKILAVVLAALALGAAAAWVWIRRDADRRWAAAQERIRRLNSDHPAVPPMPSTPVSKEIQNHFVAAIWETWRFGFGASDVIMREQYASRLVENHGGGKKVDDLLQDGRESLDEMHQGARRCAANPSEFPPGWHDEWDGAPVRLILHCCVLRSRQLRTEKRSFEAAEILLDSLQLARFWAASGKGANRLNALYSLDACLEELREILSRESLSGDQLTKVGQELEPLERAIPSSPIQILEPVLARWAETLNDWNVRDLVSPPYRWRFLPRRLMIAQAFECGEAFVQRVASGHSFSDQVLQSLQMKELEDTRNPILADKPPFVDPLPWIPLERVAQIRLLRIAARYRATGELLTLTDPYGRNLLHRRTELRMKFWSVDRDGQDDGGDAGVRGRWDRRIGTLSDGGANMPARDIVIEVERP